MIPQDDLDLIAIYMLDGDLVSAMRRYRALSDEDTLAVTTRMIQIRRARMADLISFFDERLADPDPDPQQRK